MSKIVVAFLITVGVSFQANGDLCQDLVNKMHPDSLKRNFLLCYMKRVQPCGTDFCKAKNMMKCLELYYKIQLKVFKKLQKHECLSRKI